VATKQSTAPNQRTTKLLQSHRRNWCFIANPKDETHGILNDHNGGSAQGQLLCTNHLTTSTATARRHWSTITAETRGQKSKQTRTDHNNSQA
jgi:hypothetical protein